MEEKMLNICIPVIVITTIILVILIQLMFKIQTKEIRESQYFSKNDVKEHFTNIYEFIVLNVDIEVQVNDDIFRKYINIYKIDGKYNSNLKCVELTMHTYDGKYISFTNKEYLMDYIDKNYIDNFKVVLT